MAGFLYKKRRKFVAGGSAISDEARETQPPATSFRREARTKIDSAVLDSNDRSWREKELQDKIEAMPKEHPR